MRKPFRKINKQKEEKGKYKMPTTILKRPLITSFRITVHKHIKLLFFFSLFALFFFKKKDIMRLFKKKKKPDMKLPTMVNTSSRVAERKPIHRKPVCLVAKDKEQPTVVMPKPRRAITPTRKILTGFDNDKTQIEEQAYVDALLSLSIHDGNNNNDT